MSKKSFKTINEQVEILKDRGLIFISEEHAKVELLRYGYYEIINGYKDAFLVDESSKRDRFIEGTTFEQILALFQFDKDLQHSIFQATVEMERIVKTAIAYVVAEKYGANKDEYLVRENFRSGRRNNYRGNQEYEIDQLFRKFNYIINDDIEPFKHYREEHGNIPPWILLKGATFGNVRKFYSLQKADVKEKIVSIIYDIPESMVTRNNELKNLFSDTLALCHMFRNRSAHNGRMYNYVSNNAKIRYCNLLHPKIDITNAEYRKELGKNDIPTLMAALRLIDNMYPYVYIKVGLEHGMVNYRETYPDKMMDLLKLMSLDEYNLEKIGLIIPD